MIYFLVVNYYSTNLVAKLINSLRESKNIEYRVIIINNSPEDNSINQLKSESVLIFNASNNLGFGSACNLGLQIIYAEAPQTIVWIINPDAYLLENTLSKVKPFFASHPEISILGTIIHTPTGETWFAGGSFNPLNGKISTQNLTNTNQDYIPCEWVTGCSLIINFRKFSQCPQFDPIYFLYYEDFDFCRRYAKQGHLIAITKQFSVIHQPSSITNKYIFRKIKHSTYSYLLTLNRYTNKKTLILKSTRLMCYALILIAIKPQTAIGKLAGILLYLKNARYL